jgi:hypothetical protein
MRRRLGIVALVLVTALAGCSVGSGPDRSYDQSVVVENTDDRPRDGTVRIRNDVTGAVVFEARVTVAPGENRTVFEFESVADTEAGRFAVRFDPDVGTASTVTVPMTDCLGEVRVLFESGGSDLTYSIC